MAESEVKVRVTFDIEPTKDAEVFLRRLIQEEMQAVLKMAETSESVQASVRRIAREEIEASKREQQDAVRARFGPTERKG